jgi:hypothetical protein
VTQIMRGAFIPRMPWIRVKQQPTQVAQIRRPPRLLRDLWVAKNRPVSDQTKARKDIAQAQQVIEVLLADRPEDIEGAVIAMQSRPRMWRRVQKEFDRVTASRQVVPAR